MKTDLVVAGYIFHKNKILLIHHKKLGLWLPVGGHINQNENLDQALFREVREEIGIDVELLNKSDLPVEGNVIYNLAIPFDANVHSVGDHDHCCLFYICRAINPEKLETNRELKDYSWFTKEDLNKDYIGIDVRNQCFKAFELFDKISK